MSDWARVKLNTSLGPTTRIYKGKRSLVMNSLYLPRSCMHGKTHRTFGVSPLSRADRPSFLIKSLTTVTPESLVSKFWFWMRVLIVSRGAATVIDATAPATDAIKFWVQVALE